MINDREKVGDHGDHKLSTSLQVVIPKAKRLTLPFGPTEERRRDLRETKHEHYIREIPIAGGGLGCALWDGGLVLTRWVYDNGPRIFADRSVLELGCGVGLAGIMAAHWASSVVLTDYIDETVRNALYNVTLNSADEDDDDDVDDDVDDESKTRESDPQTAPSETTSLTYRRRIRDRVLARLLDWDEEFRLGSQASVDVHTVGGDHAGLCTAAADHLANICPPRVQSWAHCRTCWPHDESSGACLACAAACHKGHDLVSHDTPERFQCDCLKLQHEDPHHQRCLCLPPQPPIDPVDIIIGSELTYNLLSCASLAAVVNKYLKRNGVFYEVLSDDRDGVAVFIAEMERLGFETIRNAAPKKYVGNFGTRKWSKQNEESYSFYTWRRRKQVDGDDTQQMPIMQ